MTKLGKRQRAQVVELLRCAADTRVNCVGLNGMFDGAAYVDANKPVVGAAWDALLDVQVGNRPREVVGTVDERYRAELLEAALRVEFGEWPPHTHERRRRRG